MDPILIDVATLNFEAWPLLCDSVINSPRTMEFALLCVQSDSEFLVMEWTGDIWAAPPESNYEIIWQKTDNEKFSFSVMGDQIAFVSDENPSVLEIIRSSEEKISIELNVNELYPKTIRWAENDLVMVGGYREDWPASWFVIDSRTGNVIWTLETSRNFDLDIQQQLNLRLIEGEISALGELIILSSNRIDVPSGNQLFLIDVTKNEFLGNVADIGHGLQGFSWYP